MEWGSSFLCICGFCRVKGLTVAGVQILPPNSDKKSNPTAGGRSQTQLGTRNGWPLAHMELLYPLTGFVLNTVGCPYPYTLLTRKPGGEDGLSRRQPNHEKG